LSISESHDARTDFDRWITAEFARSGAFTVLVVLVDIGERMVRPLCSTYFSVIGDETDWDEIVILFAGSGMDWGGAAFFPVTSPNRLPLDNPTARARLRQLEARVDADRLVLNEGYFFDRQGRGLKIEEIFVR